jgi:hypothetical protein
MQCKLDENEKTIAIKQEILYKNNSKTALNHIVLNDWNHGKYTSKAPIGESPIDVERRAVPALYDCLLHNPGKNILFVSMCMIIISR